MADIRKNRSGIDSTQLASTGSEVHAQMGGAHYKRDTSAVVSAISAFAQTQQRDANVKQEKTNESNLAKGKLDESIGRNDAELAASSQSYRDGQAHQRTVAEGLGWLNDTNVLLKQEMQDNPDFDFNEFKQRRLDEFASTKSDDPIAVGVANGMVTQFMQQVESSHSAIKHEKDVKESESLYVTTLTEAIAAGAIKSSADIKALLDDAAGSDIPADPERLKELTIALFRSRIEEGDLAAAEMLRPFTEGDAEEIIKLDAAVEHGTARLEAKQEEARKERIFNDTATWNKVEQDISNGVFTHAQGEWMVRNKYASASTVAGWYTQSTRAAQAAAKQDKSDGDILRDIGLGLGIERNGKTDATKVFDKHMRDLSNLLLSTDNPEDQKKVQDEMIRWVNTGAKGVIFSTYLKDRLENIDLTNPGPHKPFVELSLRMMDQTGGKRLLAANLAATTVAQLNVINRQIHRSGNIDTAFSVLQSMSPVTMDQANDQVNFKKSDIDKVARKLGGSGTDFGGAFREIQASSLAYTLAGFPATEAIKFAAEDYENSTEVVGGHRMSTRGTDARLKEVVEGVTKDTLPGIAGPSNKGAYFRQLPDQPNVFIAVDSTGQRPLFNKQGPIRYSYEELAEMHFNETTRLKREKEDAESTTTKADTSAALTVAQARVHQMTGGENLTEKQKRDLRISKPKENVTD